MSGDEGAMGGNRLNIIRGPVWVCGDATSRVIESFIEEQQPAYDVPPGAQRGEAPVRARACRIAA